MPIYNAFNVTINKAGNGPTTTKKYVIVDGGEEELFEEFKNELNIGDTFAATMEIPDGTDANNYPAYRTVTTLEGRVEETETGDIHAFITKLGGTRTIYRRKNAKIYFTI